MEREFGVFEHSVLRGATLINDRGGIEVGDGEFIGLKALQA